MGAWAPAVAKACSASTDAATTQVRVRAAAEADRLDGASIVWALLPLVRTRGVWQLQTARLVALAAWLRVRLQSTLPTGHVANGRDRFGHVVSNHWVVCTRTRQHLALMQVWAVGR